MISRSFFPTLFAADFKGVNAKDSPENMLEGEWDESSINVYSDPRGALGTRPGYSALTTASIGTATAWCGFFQFDRHVSGSSNSYPIGGTSDGKIYHYTAGAYEELYTGLATTDGANKRYSFFTLNNQVICASGDEAIVWAGTGSFATFATSITADFGLEWQRYGWLHSTVDPRLMYYCTTLGDPDSAYTSFINFDDDGEKVTGACKQGDDMLVGKSFALYRLQYRGTTPLFKKYRVPSKVGPVSHFTMKELPDGRVIFLAPDFNFYMASGDDVRSCGDNIQPVVRDGVNSRLQYAVAGLNYNRSQYWCSFTYTSGATKNDRTLVMDWSRPYTDKWGKIQYPWFIYNIGANCFAEMNVSGKAWIYHGGYVGKMYKDDTGTNDAGVAISATYKSKMLSHGDPTLEKKYENIALAYARKGDWDLQIQIVCDGNANTEKNIAENMLGGLGYQTLWDEFNWDEGYWSSESDIDTTREICRQGKYIQVSIGLAGVDQNFLLYSYCIHAKALRRGIRVRES